MTKLIPTVCRLGYEKEEVGCSRCLFFFFQQSSGNLSFVKVGWAVRLSMECKEYKNKKTKWEKVVEKGKEKEEGWIK